MLRLLACFKSVWDLDNVTAEEWSYLERGRFPSFMKKTLGAYDESALELALRLADGERALGRESELTAVTVGEDIEESIAKNLFAIGYAHVVHVACLKDLRFRPDLVADMLCGFINRAQKYIQTEGVFDLILAGQQANVGNNGQTHLLTAEKLGLSCVLNVIDASCSEEGVRVVSLVDEGILEQTVTPPAVLAVANAAHPYLRVPTLRERMAASRKSVLVIPGEDLASPGARRPKVVHTGLTLKKLQRECRFIQGESPEEKARMLYGFCLEGALKP